MPENAANLDETPFPLKKLFYRRIIPGLLLSLAALVILALLGTQTLIENIYLNLALNRAQSIEASISKQDPELWDTFQASRHPDLFFQTDDGKKLLGFINDITIDRRTDRFKLYSKDRVLMYSQQLETVGKIDMKADLDPVFREKRALILPKVQAGENELYIPVLDANGQIRLVFELYEKRSFFDSLVFESFLPTIVVPTILFFGLFAYLTILVKNAQHDIELRSAALSAFKKKLEQFVSLSTIQAASQASGSSEIEPARISTAIYYSDIRSFTSLSDSLPPTEVVSFLNKVMSVQIDIIKKHNGDIDKLIGDAVLAQFNGTDGERRAVLAAKEIVTKLSNMDLERSVGIGIQSGDVLACSIGSEDRKDFTIIGDTVNLAARLCSIAQPWEIVIEERTLRHSGQKDENCVGPEMIQVKGHDHPLEVFRIYQGVAEKEAAAGDADDEGQTPI